VNSWQRVYFFFAIPLGKFWFNIFQISKSKKIKWKKTEICSLFSSKQSVWNINFSKTKTTNFSQTYRLLWRLVTFSLVYLYGQICLWDKNLFILKENVYFIRSEDALYKKINLGRIKQVIFYFNLSSIQSTYAQTLIWYLLFMVKNLLNSL